MPVRSSPSWKLTPLLSSGTRRGIDGAADPFVGRLVATGAVKVVEAHQAQPSPRRGMGDQPLQLDVDLPDIGQTLIMARYPSGAIRFYAPRVIDKRRGVRGSGGTLRFTIEPPVVTDDGTRRGLVSKAIKFFVLKAAKKTASVAFPKLIALAEKRAWQNRPRGLIHVDQSSLASGNLAPVKDLAKVGSAPAKNLLFIHGTFSHTAGCYGPLATTKGANGRTLFESLRDVYGDRVFGFNHFTASESPVDNARMLLNALPDRETTFDVITHSRGALVLRTLVEERAQFGGLGRRFQVSDAVLVAGPNEGTPLAAPTRWDSLFGWLSNILELMPDNPFTMALDFIAEALTWLADQVGETIPGLASMNPDGEVVRQLQAESREHGRLFALVANHEPTDAVWHRMMDVGVDLFFGSANDLVVPTEGGWRVDPGGSPVINADRIGCFGNGGNLGGDGGVNHCSFFRQPPTVDFLVAALRGQPLNLKPLDPASALPFRSRSRRGMHDAATGASSERASQFAKPEAASPSAAPGIAGDGLSAKARRILPNSGYPADEVLSLFILDPADVLASNSADSDPYALIIASFRNARVVEPFKKAGGQAGKRWQRIISVQRNIRAYIDGDAGAPPIPTGRELVNHGRDLFETLLIGQVRRLYDAARAELTDRRLDVVFTSTVGWVADIPWEFARDPSRHTFMCLEDVNFSRNVLTAIPAESVKLHPPPLRILIVAAQPVGATTLSQDEEISVILRGFRPLLDAGLAKADVLVRATPGLLHERLESSLEDEPYDILHFIGHGEFNVAEQTGYLLFENASGGKDPLAADVFRQIVKQRRIRLVFLNACETGTGDAGSDGFAKGVAPYLVSGGIPSVVANQFKVLDPSATAFAQHFYWSLAQGRCLGDAAREARVAVNYSVTGEAIDWAVPVVFARNPGERLVNETVAGAAGPAEVLSRRAVGRRSGERRPTQIALWDVNHTIPRLEQIAADLTRAQRSFGFEVVDLLAPLGTWRRDTGGHNRRATKVDAYIEAQDIYEKLAHTPGRLSVDWLICITTFKLQAEGIQDLIADYDAERHIAIISSDELLDELSPPETSVERLIANLVAFTMSGLSGHPRGPKSCPSYYNAERDIRWTAGRLKFCSKCDNELPKEEKDSIKRLLEVFA